MPHIQVKPGSPVSRGDRLQHLSLQRHGGTAVTGEKLEDVSKQLMGAPGSKVRLTLSRSGTAGKGERD